MLDADEVDQWWQNISATAVVGTARRPVPPGPGWPVRAREDASAEVAFLDAIALGTAFRRAGSRPAITDALPASAPEDARPVAPERARQLLDLLLTQSPVGAALSALALRAWLAAAADAGFRAPHRRLPELLDRATGNPGLRLGAAAVLDRRGRWLAEQNPAWSWLLGTEGAEDDLNVDDPAGWALLPTDQRAARVRAIRSQDPARGRDLVTSTWASDPAAARATLLAALEPGLGPDDETFLETALDDRAGGVRETAYRLLDALPGSARARRLGAALAPLISSSGLVRKKVTVELPAAAEPEAVRDGLGKAPKGRSQRGLWLERLSAGAPFEIWTAATGLEPRAILGALEDADALRGLRAAILVRRDPVWAAAMLDRAWDWQLLEILPVPARAERARERIRGAKTPGDVLAAARLVPAPWPDDLAADVLAGLARLESSAYLVNEYLVVLAAGLPASSAPAVVKLAAKAEGRTADAFHHLAQHLSLLPTIRESFR